MEYKMENCILHNKPILDVCCGSRMFWFDKENPFALFTDIRHFNDTLCDGRRLSVHPDKIEDCTNLSFSDKSFKLVVFDPPHLIKVGENSWLAKKYGKLPKDWKGFINDSIHECMRVLDDYGVLIFKWNQDQIKVNDILNAITDHKPLFGHPTRRSGTTIWLCFMKIPNNINKLTKIPQITNRLGLSWEQPDTSEILVDDEYAVMSKKSFDKLKDYTASQPTALYNGKMWKALVRSKDGVLWVLRYCFNEDMVNNLIDIATRAILILE